MSGLIGAYADQELAPDAALEVERHVARCTACRNALQLQRAVHDRLRREAAPAVPLALRDRIFEAIGSAKPPAAVLAPRRRGMGWWLLAAGVAAVLAGVFVTSPRDWTPGRSPAAVEGRASDSAAILALIQAHAAAWNRRDAKAAAAVLTPDAVWVTSAGVELRGRGEIERAHAQWLAQDAAAGGSRHVHPPASIAVRFLRPDVAVADLDGQFVAPPDAKGGGGRVREEARIFVVATKDAGAWHIAQVRTLRREAHGPSPR